MSEEATFPVEPWRLREVNLDAERLARTESQGDRRHPDAVALEADGPDREVLRT